MKTIEAPKPMTLRQSIARMQNELRDAQDVYARERLKEIEGFPLSVRNLRAIVQDASRMDLNEHGERVFNYGTRHEWTQTKI
jgi:hypothetical protein